MRSTTVAHALVRAASALMQIGIIGPRFRIKSEVRLNKSPLRKILRRQTTDEEHHRGARTRACRVGTHADAWLRKPKGVHMSVNAARMSACATHAAAPPA